MNEEILIKINSWKRFANGKIWAEVVSEIKKEIENCDVIINTLGADKEVEFSKRDVAILKKNAYLDLITMPEKMIGDLAGTTEGTMEDFDPFSLDQ